ncbi:hypothetical protein [Streptomyces sp. NBC_00162]|nr:hypothetical protein [Streptomyces sp. NBC_00162]UUU44929.1 hypothetical protein JIW86_02585 [Streptomyces sp. NBC_00162]
MNRANPVHAVRAPVTVQDHERAVGEPRVDDRLRGGLPRRAARCC